MGNPAVPQVIDPTKCLPTGVTFYESREDYKAATGQDAPQFDTTRPVSRFQVANPSDPYSYTYVGRDVNGNPAMLPAQAPAAWCKFNLPGLNQVQSYAAWLAARPAVTSNYSFYGGQGIPLSKEAVFTADEANALAAEMSKDLGVPCSAVALSSPDGNSLVTFQYTDAREEYDISVNGVRYAMGDNSLNSNSDGLFQVRNKTGIGWPGKWSQPDKNLVPVFAPQSFSDYGTLGTTKTLPVPCVLPAGAVLVGTLTGIEIQIPAPDQPGTGPTDLTPVLTAIGAESAKLDKILAGLTTIGVIKA